MQFVYHIVFHAQKGSICSIVLVQRRGFGRHPLRPTPSGFTSFSQAGSELLVAPSQLLLVWY